LVLKHQVKKNVTNESIPKTYKTRNASFGDIFRLYSLMHEFLQIRSNDMSCWKSTTNKKWSSLEV